MKKILVPVVVLVIVFYGYFLFVDNSEFERIDMTEYSIVDIAQLDKKLDDWVKENKNREGISYTILDGNTYALVNAGVLGSESGIIIEEIYKNNTKYKIKYNVNEINDEEFEENTFILIKFKEALKVIEG